MSRHLIFGKQGEDEAVTYLLQKGYEILERNWRFSRAETDIIARENNTIIFIEVKARTSFAFGYPEESVSLAKQKLLVKAAENYMYQKQLPFECRFDVLAIFRSKNNDWMIKHFEDAFYPYDTGEPA